MPALSAAAVLKKLDDPDAPVLHLLAECRAPDNEAVWRAGPHLHRRFARLLLRQGHPTLALETAARGLFDRGYAGDADLTGARAAGEQ